MKKPMRKKARVALGILIAVLLIIGALCVTVIKVKK